MMMCNKLQCVYRVPGTNLVYNRNNVAVTVQLRNSHNTGVSLMYFQGSTYTSLSDVDEAGMYTRAHMPCQWRLECAANR
jgi:hypothetical protein